MKRSVRETKQLSHCVMETIVDYLELDKSSLHSEELLQLIVINKITVNGEYIYRMI